MSVPVSQSTRSTKLSELIPDRCSVCGQHPAIKETFDEDEGPMKLCAWCLGDHVPDDDQEGSWGE